MRLSLIWLFSFISLFSTAAWSAACCGGNSVSSAVITSDNKAQITTSFSEMNVTVDNVDAGGIWRKWPTHQTVKTFRIDAAHIVSDLWQVGVSVPIIQRTRQDLSYSGLGDVSTTLGYEYLPEWDYSRYRPKGVGFLQLTLPTGKSKADSEVGGLDSRGNGFWAVGAGTVLTKVIDDFDLFTSLDIHRSFEREVNNKTLNGKLIPGWGGSFSLGTGYNIADFRLGAQAMWTYEDAIVTESELDHHSGSIERYATATISGSYMFNEEWSGRISYSDQTLLGNPINTSLGQTLALQLQKNWLR